MERAGEGEQGISARLPAAARAAARRAPRSPRTDKDEKGADGAVVREGSYRNAVQTLYVAKYAYPVGKEWLPCNISAAKAERRDAVAKLCRGLAPKAL